MVLGRIPADRKYETLASVKSGRANGIGASRLRTEDFRLVTGRGSYIDDVLPENACHAVMVRSPHAHATILSIDTDAALAMPGAHNVC